MPTRNSLSLISFGTPTSIASLLIRSVSAFVPLRASLQGYRGKYSSCDKSSCAKVFLLRPSHKFRRAYPRRLVWSNKLEPISKSFEEDDEASELHEAKEVLRIELPGDRDG